MNIETSLVRWLPCWRIIPSRFPPIGLFERVVDPADLEAIIAIESITNPRLRDEVGDIELVPSDERISGPGTSIIMAAFTYLNPEGSRFSNGQFGIFYAGDTVKTAIRETVYHRGLFMQATSQPRMELDQRAYTVDLEAELHDIRGQRDRLPLLYDPIDYSSSQQLARTLRTNGSNGIVYDSVRHETGECVGIFRPKVLSNCRPERHLCYVWDGQKIGDVYEKRSLT